MVGSGQYLVVYPESLVIVRLRKDTIRKCAYGLTQQVLLSFCSPPTRGGDGSGANGQMEEEEQQLGDFDMVSFWSYCETAEEISLIVTEVLWRHRACLAGSRESLDDDVHMSQPTDVLCSSWSNGCAEMLGVV